MQAEIEEQVKDLKKRVKDLKKNYDSAQREIEKLTGAEGHAAEKEINKMLDANPLMRELLRRENALQRMKGIEEARSSLEERLREIITERMSDKELGDRLKITETVRMGPVAVITREIVGKKKDIGHYKIGEKTIAIVPLDDPLQLYEPLVGMTAEEAIKYVRDHSDHYDKTGDSGIRMELIQFLGGDPFI